MPRLKFDLQPIVGGRRDPEEHDQWVRSYFSQHFPNETPRPCDCGFRGDAQLVACTAESRKHCHKDVRARLEYHYRARHLEGLREKRKFPGPPNDGLGRGFCRWCGQEIINRKTGQRHARRTWCAHGRCLHAFNLHTNLETQQSHLVDRDGPGCRGCGTLAGRWAPTQWISEPEALRARGFDRPADVWVGPYCVATWRTHLEVDHFIALAVAWEAFGGDDRRRWFFSPANLRLLCHDCHRAKTNEDRALLREIAKHGAEWAKAEVLHRLADARLIRPAANPKSEIP